MIRKILFWAHLIAGCVGGVIILLMSITGVLLTYERQMIAKGERGAYQVKDGGTAIPVESVLQPLELAAGATVTLRAAATEPLEVNLGKAGLVYLDPYTGQKLGSPDKGTREFFQKLRAWHRWIALEGDWRPVGKAITGACTLAFVGLVLSGMYLWIPRVVNWKTVRAVGWFRSGLSGKARDFNWHNVVGIWSAVPLFFVIVSALPISYPWANDLIYTVTQSEKPAGGAPPAMKGQAQLSGLNAVVAAAKTQSGWQSLSFRPGSGDEPVVVTVDRGDGGQPQLKSTLTVERATGSVLSQERFSDFNTGRQVRMFSRFLHTGESLGLIGQTVAGLVSLGGAVLVWTGLALSWRRFRSWQTRAKAAKTMKEDVRETVAA